MTRRPIEMKLHLLPGRKLSKVLSAFLLIVPLSVAGVALGQRRVARNFPAGKNVRVELRNISGTITVETWNRDEIRVTADMESSKTTFSPRETASGLVIDIVGDNRGRNDVGDMNFKIQLPARSSVDLETRSGQITVNNVQGDLVRAHIWTSGDIILTSVNAGRVFATNTTGDIFFDGDFASGGTYEFKSGQGTITLQVPVNCGFRLVATAPAQKISMGKFWNPNMKTLGEGRRIIGDVGDGRASVTVTNYNGDIKFRLR